jgi:hypothetical protein
MLTEDLTFDSIIIPNTGLLVIQGGFSRYFVEDYLTGELIEYIPIHGTNRYSSRKVPIGSTYRDRMNTEEDKVFYMSEGLHPFHKPDFVSTYEGLYRVVLEPMISYISDDMEKLLDGVYFKLENLATGEISYAKYKDIHERWFNGERGVYSKEFCKDLYNISRTGSDCDRAFIKGLVYPGIFKDDLNYGASLVTENKENVK